MVAIAIAAVSSSRRSIACSLEDINLAAIAVVVNPGHIVSIRIPVFS